MTRLAHLVLLLTSIAPVLFVFAATQLFGAPTLAALLFAAVALLVLVAWGLLALSARRVEQEPRAITEASTRERETLSFLVAYALPMVAAGRPAELLASKGLLAGVLAFTFVLTLAVWQLQMLYVNPLLALLGYHFFSATCEDGAQVLVLARQKTLSTGSLRVAVLSDYLWLKV